MKFYIKIDLNILSPSYNLSMVQHCSLNVIVFNIKIFWIETYHMITHIINNFTK